MFRDCCICLRSSLKQHNRWFYCFGNFSQLNFIVRPTDSWTCGCEAEEMLSSNWCRVFTEEKLSEAEDNNSQDSTLLQVFKLRVLLLCCNWETSSGRNYKLTKSDNMMIKCLYADMRCHLGTGYAFMLKDLCVDRVGGCWSAELRERNMSN